MPTRLRPPTDVTAPAFHTAPFAFDNTFAREMEGFYVHARPASARSPRLVAFNRELAEELGLDADALDSEAGARSGAGAPTRIWCIAST